MADNHSTAKEIKTPPLPRLLNVQTAVRVPLPVQRTVSASTSAYRVRYTYAPVHEQKDEAAEGHLPSGASHPVALIVPVRPPKPAAKKAVALRTFGPHSAVSHTEPASHGKKSVSGSVPFASPIAGFTPGFSKPAPSLSSLSLTLHSPTSSQELLQIVQKLGSMPAVQDALVGGKRKVHLSDGQTDLVLRAGVHEGGKDHLSEVMKLFSPESARHHPLLTKLFVMPLTLVYYTCSPQPHPKQERSLLLSMPIERHPSVSKGGPHHIHWESMPKEKRVQILAELSRMLSELHAGYGLTAGDLDPESILLTREGKPKLESAAHIGATGSHSHGIPELVVLLSQFYSRNLITHDDVHSILSAYLLGHPLAKAHAREFLEHRFVRRKSHTYLHNPKASPDEQLLAWFDYFHSHYYSKYFRPAQKPVISSSGSKGSSSNSYPVSYKRVA